MTTCYATHLRYLEHNRPGHPEHAGRLQAVWQRLHNTGLDQQMNPILPQPITNDLILTVHSPQYLDSLRWIAAANQPLVQLDPDTYATPTTFEVARLAAGGVTAAVDSVMQGAAHNGLAAVRPPGHHAMPDYAMGFCVLGNIALAARHAQQVHHIERVLILDYDVHHGNGTEAMFYDDPTVLYISTHQFPYYPGTGRIDQIGKGAGRGFNLNIPLSAGHGDSNYAALFEQIVWPAAERFQPQLMLISAGFDAHWNDPLASMRLSLTGYDHLNRELIKMAEAVCEGRIVFVLEGGYHLDALAYGVENLARALLGDSHISDPLGPPGRYHEPDIQPLIAQLRQLHELPL